MIDKLREHITQRLGNEPDNLDLVIPHFQEITVKRGTHLLRQGEPPRFVYFIIEGLLQVYVVDKNGKESTREIYIEDQWVTDIFGFQNQLPSSEFIKCVEPCRLLRIGHTSFQKLSQDIPQFAAIYRQILEVSYNNTVYRVNTLTAMDGLEKIKWFQEHKPKLRTRISSKLIASYLGISPETMTRLKAKL